MVKLAVAIILSQCCMPMAQFTDAHFQLANAFGRQRRNRTMDKPGLSRTSSKGAREMLCRIFTVSFALLAVTLWVADDPIAGALPGTQAEYDVLRVTRAGQKKKTGPCGIMFLRVCEYHHACAVENGVCVDDDPCGDCVGNFQHQNCENTDAEPCTQTNVPCCQVRGSCTSTGGGCICPDTPVFNVGARSTC